jgi:outer membrane protein OmpA-like peptidoglycan-associated protein
MSRPAVWIILALGLWSLPTLAEPPTLAFLGVYEATASDPLNSALERELLEELGHWTEVVLRTPSQLDHAPGRTARIVVLSSRTPQQWLSEYAHDLGNQYALSVSVRNIQGVRDATLTLWNLPDGLPLAVETVNAPRSLADGLKLLHQRLLDHEKAGRPSRVPAVAPIRHVPVTRAPANLPWTIEATFTCPAACEGTVLYRAAGATSWRTADMVPTGRANQRVAGLSPMQPGWAEYYISVADEDLNQLSFDGTAQQPHRLQLVAAPAPSPAVQLLPPPPPRADPSQAPPILTQTEPVSRVGIALVAVGGASLVSSLVLGLVASHQDGLIHGGTLATGGDIQHAAVLNQRLNVASLLTGIVGAVATGTGVVLLLQPHAAPAPPALPAPAPVSAPPPPVDTDGDGLPDSVDRCPTVKGSAENGGCPFADTDQDGVPDVDDRCPTVPGSPALRGCPDADQDGVPDIDDKCPQLAGPAQFGGCPDTDHDGIPDIDDKCPLVPGEPALGGCPAYKQVELKNDRLQIKEKIFFYHGSAKIEDRSDALLDEVAQLLKDRPDLRVRVEGHTDTSGKEPRNVALSQARAGAVRDYLTARGVAAERLDAKGYGSSRPIDSNKTLNGRENNRRVEFVVIR